jgi:hypothetical protein
MDAIASSEAAGARTNLAFARIALGILELTAWNPAAAIRHFEEVSAFSDEVGFSHCPVLWWSSDLLECYVSEGMDDAARRELGSRREEHDSAERSPDQKRTHRHEEAGLAKDTGDYSFTQLGDFWTLPKKRPVSWSFSSKLRSVTQVIVRPGLRRQCNEP